ncbi:hypothetical protein J6590_030159 [Homalodisca vitripennis]|nr:hypothetical protein J6590_030159 [Homalodisca vitripennis]
MRPETSNNFYAKLMTTSSVKDIRRSGRPCTSISEVKCLLVAQKARESGLTRHTVRMVLPNVLGFLIKTSIVYKSENLKTVTEEWTNSPLSDRVVRDDCNKATFTRVEAMCRLLYDNGKTIMSSFYASCNKMRHPIFLGVIWDGLHRTNVLQEVQIVQNVIFFVELRQGRGIQAISSVDTKLENGLLNYVMQVFHDGTLPIRETAVPEFWSVDVSLPLTSLENRNTLICLAIQLPDCACSLGGFVTKNIKQKSDLF